MTLRTLLLSACAAASFIAAPAFAQDETDNNMPASKPVMGEQMQEDAVKPLKYDTNGDDMLSKEEFLDRYVKYFNKIDLDGDGILSRAEVEAEDAARAERAAKRRAAALEAVKQDDSEAATSDMPSQTDSDEDEDEEDSFFGRFFR